MPVKTLKSRLESGERLLGFATIFSSPATIEMVGGQFDWVWIDAQHGLWDRTSAADALRAADLVGTHSVLRVPGHEYGIIGPFIDLAPSAVMVPMVDNAEQAARVVEAVHFPPLGKRSYGGRRVVDRYGRGYPHMAEATPLLIAQIETPEGVENADAVAATPGVDALLFGADDFRLRLGVDMADPQPNPKVDEAMLRIIAACQAHGKFGGIIPGSDSEALKRFARAGYQLLLVGSDTGAIRTWCRDSLDSAEGTLASL